MSNAASYDWFTHNEPEPAMQVGTVMKVNGQIAPSQNTTTAGGDCGSCWVRYVKAEDANITQGQAVEWASGTDGEVSADRSGGTALTYAPAGVALAAITDGQYGFVQCGGVGMVDLGTDENVAAGDFLICDVSTNGDVIEWVPASATTLVMMNQARAVIGVATAADVSARLDAGNYILSNLM